MVDVAAVLGLTQRELDERLRQRRRTRTKFRELDLFEANLLSRVALFVLDPASKQVALKGTVAGRVIRCQCGCGWDYDSISAFAAHVPVSDGRVDGPALRDKKHRLGEVFVHPNGTRFTLERPVSIANLCAFLGDRCRDLADAELQSTLPGMVHSRVQANLLGGSSAERPSQIAGESHAPRATDTPVRKAEAPVHCNDTSVILLGDDSDSDSDVTIVGRKGPQAEDVAGGDDRARHGVAAGGGEVVGPMAHAVPSPQPALSQADIGNGEMGGKAGPGDEAGRACAGKAEGRNADGAWKASSDEVHAAAVREHREGEGAVGDAANGGCEGEGGRSRVGPGGSGGVGDIGDREGGQGKLGGKASSSFSSRPSEGGGQGAVGALGVEGEAESQGTEVVDEGEVDALGEWALSSPPARSVPSASALPSPFLRAGESLGPAADGVVFGAVSGGALDPGPIEPSVGWEAGPEGRVSVKDEPRGDGFDGGRDAREDTGWMGDNEDEKVGGARAGAWSGAGGGVGGGAGVGVRADAGGGVGVGGGSGAGGGDSYSRFGGAEKSPGIKGLTGGERVVMTKGQQVAVSKGPVALGKRAAAALVIASSGRAALSRALSRAPPVVGGRQATPEESCGTAEASGTEGESSDERTAKRGRGSAGAASDGHLAKRGRDGAGAASDARLAKRGRGGQDAPVAGASGRADRMGGAPAPSRAGAAGSMAPASAHGGARGGVHGARHLLAPQSIPSSSTGESASDGTATESSEGESESEKDESEGDQQSQSAPGNHSDAELHAIERPLLDDVDMEEHEDVSDDDTGVDLHEPSARCAVCGGGASAVEIVTLQTGLGDGDRRPVKCSLNDPVREFAPRRQGEPGEPAHAHECCVVFNDFASKALRSAIKRGDAVGEALDSLAPEDVLAMAGRASDACGTKRCYLCGHTSYGTEGEVGSPATQCCWRKDSKAERCQNFAHPSCLVMACQLGACLVPFNSPSAGWVCGHHQGGSMPGLMCLEANVIAPRSGMMRMLDAQRGALSQNTGAADSAVPGSSRGSVGTGTSSTRIVSSATDGTAATGGWGTDGPPVLTVDARDWPLERDLPWRAVVQGIVSDSAILTPKHAELKTGSLGAACRAAYVLQEALYGPYPESALPEGIRDASRHNARVAERTQKRQLEFEPADLLQGAQGHAAAYHGAQRRMQEIDRATPREQRRKFYVDKTRAGPGPPPSQQVEIDMVSHTRLAHLSLFLETITLALKSKAWRTYKREHEASLQGNGDARMAPAGPSNGNPAAPDESWSVAIAEFEEGIPKPGMTPAGRVWSSVWDRKAQTEADLLSQACAMCKLATATKDPVVLWMLRMGSAVETVAPSVLPQNNGADEGKGFEEGLVECAVGPGKRKVGVLQERRRNWKVEAMRKAHEDFSALTVLSIRLTPQRSTARAIATGKWLASHVVGSAEDMYEGVAAVCPDPRRAGRAGGELSVSTYAPFFHSVQRTKAREENRLQSIPRGVVENPEWVVPRKNKEAEETKDQALLQRRSASLSEYLFLKHLPEGVLEAGEHGDDPALRACRGLAEFFSAKLAARSNGSGRRGGQRMPAGTQPESWVFRARSVLDCRPLPEFLPARMALDGDKWRALLLVDRNGAQGSTRRGVTGWQDQVGLFATQFARGQAESLRAGAVVAPYEGLLCSSEPNEMAIVHLLSATYIALAMGTRKETIQAQDAVALIDHAIDVIERFAYTVNDTNDMSGLEHLKLRTHGSVAEVSPYPFITAAGCANDPFMSKYALENGGPSDKSDGSGSSDLNLTRGSVRAPVPATSTPGAAGSTSNAQSDWRARPAFPTAGARSGHVLCTSRKSNLPQAQGGAGAARDRGAEGGGGCGRGAEGGGLSRFTTQRVLMEGLKDNAIVEPLLVFGFPLPFMVCKDDVDHEFGYNYGDDYWAGKCAAEPLHLAELLPSPPNDPPGQGSNDPRPQPRPE